jgi:anti-anti-sigma regulatory factor
MTVQADDSLDGLAAVRRRRFQPAQAGWIEVEPERDRVRVRCGGALDTASAAELRAECEGLLDRGFAHFLLDLSQTRSIGPDAVSAIARIDRRARALGSQLSVAPGAGGAAATLRRAGLLGSLGARGRQRHVPGLDPVALGRARPHLGRYEETSDSAQPRVTSDQAERRWAVGH